MDDLLRWVEAHPGLAGYVQALGSFVALVVAIGVPTWQRRSIERAAELTFGSVLVECHTALNVIECFAADDGLEFDIPGPPSNPPKFSEIAQDLVRATARLDRVSLFEFKPKCAALIHKLQREMSDATDLVGIYVEHEDEGVSLDLYNYGLDETVYRLMLDILNAMSAFKDKGLSEMLRRQLDRIEQRRANMPRIKRVRVKRAA